MTKIAKRFLTFSGVLVILVIASLGILVFAVEEMEIESESEGFRPRLNLNQAFSFLERGQANIGDEDTGQVTAWLFGLANLPIAFSLTAKFINRQTALPAIVKDTVSRLYVTQRKYLMPLHTYLSLMALAVGGAHLWLSKCPNPFPEWGLAGMAVLAGSGLLIKLKLVPSSWVKGIYKFHSSLMVTAIVLSILLAGHLLMD